MTASRQNTVDRKEMDVMVGVERGSRAIAGRIVLVGLAAIACLLAAGSVAQAAPQFDVQLTRSEIRPFVKGDQYVTYDVSITNTASPNPATGTALTCVPNNWTPASGVLAPTLTYQWLRDGVAIGTASAVATYTLQAADAGHAVQCQVFGTNSNATTTSVSAPVTPAPAPATAVPAPSSPTAAAARPTITPTTPAAVGAGVNLTCNPPANWTGAPTYSYQWLANGAPIVGATAALYTTQAGDLGKVLQCRVLGTNAGGTTAGVSLNRLTTGLTAANVPTNTAANTPAITTPDHTSGTTTVAFGFSPGVSLGDGSKKPSGNSPWTCHSQASTCAASEAVLPGGTFAMLPVTVWIDPEVAPDVITTTVTVYGGGALSDAIVQDSFIQSPTPPFEISSFTAAATDSVDADYTQAGGHPYKAESSAEWPYHIAPDGNLRSNEDVRDVFFDLPAGFVGNPQAATHTCTILEVQGKVCPEAAAVGGIDVDVDNTLNLAGDNDLAATPVPLYRVKAAEGYPATFAFVPVSIASLTYVLRPKLRSNGDYGITVVSPLAPQKHGLVRIKKATLCNYGAKTVTGIITLDFGGCKSPGDTGAFEVPFLSNPTECTAQGPVTELAIDSWQHPAALTADGFVDRSDPNWKTAAVESPATTGCDLVPFEPSMSVDPTSAGRDSASGLDVDLDVPQDGLLDPDGIATSHLKKTVVELPEGFSVNPSAATGLEGCSDAQIAQNRLTAPECPEASKLGTVKVTSPLVDEELDGVMYLGTPKSTDPTSGEMLRLWISVRNDDLGLSAKLPGSTVADPQTGRLTATFDNNPRVPFDHLEVDLRGGGKGVLATSQDCGTKTTSAVLSPWSGTDPVDQSTDTDISGDCAEKFAPNLAAGSSDSGARGQGGTYSFKFSREDGEQWLRGLTATLPRGLLASVKDVPLCSNAAADAGNCPADSKIGIVDAKAGVGDPFVLEQKGEVFLTEGYKGGEYGLAVKVRPVAGPFRGEFELSPIIVRQAIHVDRTTAQVTAISDPFPVIHHGIPLRVREVNVLVNRSGFMLNPSDCSAKQTRADLVSTENTTAALADAFQVTGCPALAFKPKLALALKGRRQVRTGKHPAIRAKVTQQGVSEAGIRRAQVRLPKSLALDPDNAQALCEFADGTKPDLENHCPKGSIVGRARAKTPLLNKDLVGNVYFVKNVRIDKDTGNEIRTLPMIIVALRGEISVNLTGESSTTNGGKLVNTFNNVPDAPISQFNLNIKGGKNGILAVTRTRRAKINLCAGRHIAEADTDGQNGRRHDFDIRMKTPCTKKQTRKAKRAAKRAAKQSAHRR